MATLANLPREFSGRARFSGFKQGEISMTVVAKLRSKVGAFVRNVRFDNPKAVSVPIQVQEAPVPEQNQEQKQNISNDRFDLRYKFHLTNYRGDASLEGITVPKLEYAEPEFDAKRDTAIAKRLIRAYRLSVQEYGDSLGADGVWKNHAAHTFAQLYHHINANDSLELARLLSRTFRSPLTIGMGMGELEYKITSIDPQPYSLIWHDRALTLCVALGLKSLQNPEQGGFGTTLQQNSVEAFDLLNAHYGDIIHFPQVGACFGVRARCGIIPLHFLQYLYAAIRMQTLARGKPWDGLEIGGGFGGLAYASALFGARRYTLIDLAPVNVIQGYFLLHSEFKDRVVLFGEDAASQVHNPIYIACGGHIRNCRSQYDFVVNQDSMPEMSRETTIDYLKEISRIRPKYFLSMNQEARAAAHEGTTQNWVFELCRECHVPFDLLYRAPYWMREGYTEELYVRTDRAA